MINDHFPPQSLELLSRSKEHCLRKGEVWNLPDQGLTFWTPPGWCAALGNPPSEGGTPAEQSFIPTSSFVLALFTTWQPRPSVTTNGMTSTPKEEIRSYLFSRLSLLAILHSCSSKEGSVNTQNISELMLSCQKEINPRTKLQKGGTEKSNLFWLKMLISLVHQKSSHIISIYTDHIVYIYPT